MCTSYVERARARVRGRDRETESEGKRRWRCTKTPTPRKPWVPREESQGPSLSRKRERESEKAIESKREPAQERKSDTSFKRDLIQVSKET